jgi:hypothetical protein
MFLRNIGWLSTLYPRTDIFYFSLLHFSENIGNGRPTRKAITLRTATTVSTWMNGKRTRLWEPRSLATRPLRVPLIHCHHNHSYVQRTIPVVMQRSDSTVQCTWVQTMRLSDSDSCFLSSSKSDSVESVRLTGHSRHVSYICVKHLRSSYLNRKLTWSIGGWSKLLIEELHNLCSSPSNKENGIITGKWIQNFGRETWKGQ